MSKDLKLSLGSIKSKVQKAFPKLVKHGSFIAIIVVLVIYLFVVWRISSLAGAEPPATDDVAAASIPKVDKKAIEQIQSLAQSNKQVESFFNSARNNPFSEWHVSETALS